jgi:hypothetical protein
MAGGRAAVAVLPRRRRARRALVALAVVAASAMLPAGSDALGADRWGVAAPPEGRGLDRVAGAPAGVGGSAAGGPSADGGAAPSESCEPGAPRAADRFDPFYGQVCWVLAIPVLASGDVDQRALVAAAGIVAGVLGPRPDVGQLVARRGMKVAVLGRHERAVELPEYRDLPRRYPGEDWDAARAYSATATHPLLTAPEENLACAPADTYPGQQVLVHELGHSVMDLAVRPSDPSFWGRVERAYAHSLGAGRWVGYYGATSAGEYWAEGVQAYFDAGARSTEPDPYGSPVADREQLAAYDPGLFELVREVFTDNPWRAPRCP